MLWAVIQKKKRCDMISMLLKAYVMWMYIFKRTHFRMERENLEADEWKGWLKWHCDSDQNTFLGTRPLFCFVFFHLFVLLCKNQSYKHSVGSHGGDNNWRVCKWNHTMFSAFVGLTNMSGMLCCQHILDLDCIFFFFLLYFFSLEKLLFYIVACQILL